MLVYRDNVVVYILSTVKTENTYTPARLERLCLKAVSRHHFSAVVIRSIRTICIICTIQDSKAKLLRKRLCSQSIQMLREETCCVPTRKSHQYFHFVLFFCFVVL